MRGEAASFSNKASVPILFGPQQREGGEHVFASGDAFEHEGNVECLFDPRDGAPIEGGLELAAGDAAASRGDKALGKVALAAALDRGIDRETERRIAVVDRAAHPVVHE